MTNTMEPKCPLCGSKNKKIIYDKTLEKKAIDKYSYKASLEGHYPIVECLNCKIHFSCPRDTDKELDKMYSEGSIQEYSEQSEGKKAYFEKEAEYIKNICGKEKKVLDIGCANGIFLETMKEKGYEVAGCDPWREAAEIAKKKLGNCIEISKFEDTNYPKNYFDVVAIWSVVEHVANPDKYISDITSLLKPGGWLVLSTPNYGSLSRKVLGTKWHFFERVHLTFFCPKTIKSFLKNKGYKNITIKPHAKVYNLLYRARYTAKISKAVSIMLVWIFNTIKPLGKLVIRFPLSGSMQVYAKKGAVLKKHPSNKSQL
jgi:2-polyprenyl-3-methyl-5-hydroxy-6-metoxy-1,4-benzoquinol methylase